MWGTRSKLPQPSLLWRLPQPAFPSFPRTVSLPQLAFPNPYALPLTETPNCTHQTPNCTRQPHGALTTTTRHHRHHRARPGGSSTPAISYGGKNSVSNDITIGTTGTYNTGSGFLCGVEGVATGLSTNHPGVNSLGFLFLRPVSNAVISYTTGGTNLVDPSTDSSNTKTIYQVSVRARLRVCVHGCARARARPTSHPASPTPHADVNALRSCRAARRLNAHPQACWPPAPPAPPSLRPASHQRAPCRAIRRTARRSLTRRACR